MRDDHLSRQMDDDWADTAASDQSSISSDVYRERITALECLVLNLQRKVSGEVDKDLSKIQSWNSIVGWSKLAFPGMADLPASP